MSYSDDALIDELRSGLVEVWRDRVPRSNIKEVVALAVARPQFSGITVVGPTRDRSLAVTGALCDFLDMAFNTTDLGASAAVKWQMFPVSGGESDEDILENSLAERRHIWLTVPSSPCSVARFWGVCDAHASRYFGLSSLHMNALIPDHLVGTYLATEFFGHTIRKKYEGFVSSYPRAPETNFAAGTATTVEPNATQRSLVHLTPEAFEAFRDRYADIGPLAIKAVHRALRTAGRKDIYESRDEGGDSPGIAQR